MSILVHIVKKHCLSLLQKSRCNNLPFHNTKHTIEVYENVMRIGIYERIDRGQ